MEFSPSIVGVFDSGVGGMSVLSAIRKRMPNLDVIYVGDNVRAPYGNRTEEEVKQYTKEILRFLQRKGCTHFVSACNSISALVTQEILDELGIKASQYVDMVQPTKKYVTNAHIGRLLVLATVLTTKSKVYEAHLSPLVGEYVGIGEPNLARQIEFNEGKEEIRETISSFFTTQKGMPHATLLLSCTHYPLVRHVFEEEGSGFPIDIVDPSEYVAQEVEIMVDDTNGRGTTLLCMTRESETMSKLTHELGVDGYTIVSL
ncbi:MAG: glutamate racemase [Patescibacteria group bacterium]|nr:glutamate racemase [Patescibacteria group bacterium]